MGGGLGVDPPPLLRMPTYYPESNTASSTDGELRALQKWAQLWFILKGNVACSFPEGTQPLSTDNEERLWQKIVVMKNS